MNSKNRAFTLISVGVLSLAIAVVGLYVYFSNPQVMADVNEDLNTNFYTAKQGWNYYTSGGKIINQESRIISINRSLISIAEAKKRGIIGEISVIKDGKIVLRDVEVVPVGEDFAILFNDISLNPEVYLGE